MIIEELEHAKKRNARIYAEIIGYGMSSDAYHIMRLHLEGDGARRTMAAAIDDVGLDPSEIDLH